MSEKFIEIKDIEEIARTAHSGIDISEHFTGNFQAKQQINIVFPLELLHSIDLQCEQQKIDRQDWIKQVCAEKIRQIQADKEDTLREEYDFSGGVRGKHYQAYREGTNQV